MRRFLRFAVEFLGVLFLVLMAFAVVGYLLWKLAGLE